MLGWWWSVNKLSELAPTRRFRLPHTGRTGVVLAHGEMGSSVRYDNSARHVKGTSKRTDQTFEFEAPGRVVIISGGTEVEPL